MAPEPGLNGKHRDPAAGFSDMQWFMLRQGNVAHYAAFSSLAYDEAALVGIARRLVELAPQLAAAGGAPDDAVLRRLVGVRPAPDFGGFPDAVIDAGPDVATDPDLPMFRLSAYVRAGGPDPEGRAAFLVVRVSHALVEGADSALLSRSRPAAHPVSRSATHTGSPPALAAAVLGAVAALAHLLVGNLAPPRNGPYRFVSRVVPRSRLAGLARELGVSQRALCFALVMHALFGAGTPSGKRRISATYSTIDSGGGAHRDTYMRMRMLFGLFANAGDFPSFARAVEAGLRRAEARETGFNAEFSAAGLHVHRRLSRLIPFAYGPRLFAFMPYDIVIGLIPPHRLGGPLTEGLLEPVYCGAATPGANACVIVPGRHLASFNFYIEEKLGANLAALDALLGGNALSSGSSRAGHNVE